MENRCGKEKERKDEERRGEKRKKKGIKDLRKQQKDGCWCVCVIVCPYIQHIQCVRLTMCVWVAVKTLTWRSTAEV